MPCSGRKFKFLIRTGVFRPSSIPYNKSQIVVSGYGSLNKRTYKCRHIPICNVTFYSGFSDCCIVSRLTASAGQFPNPTSPVRIRLVGAIIKHKHLVAGGVNPFCNVGCRKQFCVRLSDCSGGNIRITIIAIADTTCSKNKSQTHCKQSQRF